MRKKDLIETVLFNACKELNEGDEKELILDLLANGMNKMSEEEIIIIINKYGKNAKVKPMMF